ncbi:MAG: hypothetical protein II269_09365 [Bacteroidaceae bacterium]|nr:hypothetical protein [Bacteroidaceae bacterium]
MGIKSCRFTGRNGHEYEVALVGATVATATINLGIPPATISMAAGEHKFCGFKSTTATVNILTDVPLIELYSAGVTDIRLTIEDITADKVEFDGYVTPFAFDQPYTGKNDSVTVNAVDLLTARKEVKYENITTDNEREYGADRYAIDIIASLAHSAGIEAIVEHINFDVTTTSPLHVKVAQAGFLQDEVGELDALSAICKFFGMTACCVGRTLYLYDEHCLLHANQGNRINANVYDISEGRAVRTAQYYDSQDTPLNDQVLMSTDAVRNDISVTIERAYDGIQITPEGSDTSVLLPDVCADENMEDSTDSGLGTSRRTYTDSGYVQFRTPRSSKWLNTGADGLTAFPNTGVDWMKPSSDNNSYWITGAIPMTYDHYTKEATPSPSDSEVAEYITGGDNRSMIWLRSAVETAIVGQQKAEKRYSHTGGYVRVDLSLRAVARGNWQKPEGSNVNADFERIKFVQLRCGTQFYKSTRSGGEWSDAMDSPISVKGGKILTNDTAANLLTQGFIVKVASDQPIYVELRGRGSSTVTRDYYIESLSISGAGDPINTDNAQLRHVYNDKDGDMLGVSTMLTSRKSGVVGELVDGHRPYGVNARPAVVTDTEWNGGYMGRADSESIPISGILMEQLKARYAQPRICYKMTVEKNIKPYAAVYFGGKGYTVEAYDKDLYNSTTTITID